MKKVVCCTKWLFGSKLSRAALLLIFKRDNLKRVQLVIVCLFSSITYANPPESYPPIGYRDHRYTGVHCKPLNPITQTPELYILKNSGRKIYGGKPFKAEIAEFFSGRRYLTLLKPRGASEAKVEVVGKNLILQCFSGHVFAKEYPVDASGDYIVQEGVGTAGSFGNTALNMQHMCDAGKNGWVDCDVGTTGLVRRSATGVIKWARLIAIGVPFKDGHPLYDLPRALNIIDEYDEATLLNDGTAVFTYMDHMSIRVDLKTGIPISSRPDVASVPLDDWAKLKQILYERREGHAGSTCEWSNTKCWKDLIRMYFYGLQNYLFPSFIER